MLTWLVAAPVPTITAVVTNHCGSSANKGDWTPAHATVVADGGHDTVWVTVLTSINLLHNLVTAADKARADTVHTSVFAAFRALHSSQNRDGVAVHVLGDKLHLPVLPR